MPRPSAVRLSVPSDDPLEQVLADRRSRSSPSSSRGDGRFGSRHRARLERERHSRGKSRNLVHGTHLKQKSPPLAGGQSMIGWLADQSRHRAAKVDRATTGERSRSRRWRSGSSCESLGRAELAGGQAPAARLTAWRGAMALGLAPASGCSSMVEQKPSKLTTRVRFPSPAPKSGHPGDGSKFGARERSERRQFFALTRVDTSSARRHMAPPA